MTADPTITTATATAAGSASLPPLPVRARSVAARDEATVCVAGATYSRSLAHTITAEGRVLVAVAGDGPVAMAARSGHREDLPGMLVITDICPVAVRDRVRGSVWLTGGLRAVTDVAAAVLTFAETRPVGCLLDVVQSAGQSAGQSVGQSGRPGATLVELWLADVILSDQGGTTDVPVAVFRAAAPDPLHDDEAMALRHLDAAHRDVLETIARRAPGVDPGLSRARPVALDSRAITVRLGREEDAGTDLRIAFDPPLRHVAELGEALKSLSR